MMDVEDRRFDVAVYNYTPDERRGRYHSIHVKAGRCHTERVVPPAGEDYAFDREVWDHRIEIGISPTGRSVRVYVDGERVA